MKVILKNKIVDVKEGYARNYLFPYKLAIPATEENMRKLEQRKDEVERELKEEEKKLEDLAKKYDGKSVTIKKEAGEEKKLFGSVTKKEIIKAFRFPSESNVILTVPIKELGEYKVPVKFGRHMATVVVKVVPEEK